MPTILRFAGLRIVVYPNDHRPPHVHIIGNGCEAVFMLNCPDGPVELRENFGFGRVQLSRVERELNHGLDHLCRGWEKIHGVE